VNLAPRSRVVDDRHVPTTHEGKLEPNYYCRAWNAKRLKYCRNRAGAGTDTRAAGAAGSTTAAATAG
jgi:hypothetical protein